MFRASSWDLYGPNGKPATDIDSLLSALGGFGKPVTEQQGLIAQWLESPAARPAPRKLVVAARKFLEVGNDSEPADS